MKKLIFSFALLAALPGCWNRFCCKKNVCKTEQTCSTEEATPAKIVKQVRQSGPMQEDCK